MPASDGSADALDLDRSDTESSGHEGLSINARAHAKRRLKRRGAGGERDAEKERRREERREKRRLEKEQEKARGAEGGFAGRLEELVEARKRERWVDFFSFFCSLSFEFALASGVWSWFESMVCVPFVDVPFRGVRDAVGCESPFKTLTRCLRRWR